jgi:hypothetical protein
MVLILAQYLLSHLLAAEKYRLILHAVQTRLELAEHA